MCGYLHRSPCYEVALMLLLLLLLLLRAETSSPCRTNWHRVPKKKPIKFVYTVPFGFYTRRQIPKPNPIASPSSNVLLISFFFLILPSWLVFLYYLALLAGRPSATATATTCSANCRRRIHNKRANVCGHVLHLPLHPAPCSCPCLCPGGGALPLQLRPY